MAPLKVSEVLPLNLNTLTTHTQEMLTLDRPKHIQTYCRSPHHNDRRTSTGWCRIGMHARKVIPKPNEGFRERLKMVPTPGKTLPMKQVNSINKNFKDMFSDSYKERWAEHINRFETEMHIRAGKQCYYTLKRTLKAEANRSLQSIELGLEKVDYSTSVVRAD